MSTETFGAMNRTVYCRCKFLEVLDPVIVPYPVPMMNLFPWLDQIVRVNLVPNLM